MDFVDHVVVHIRAGDGGNGCASIHREKFKPLGGPDGGNGGRGGDIILEVDSGTPTLLDYHKRPHRRAGKGGQGRGGHRAGANGDDLVLPVPDGTVVKTPDGDVIADLVGAGTRFVVGQGGKGGLGNAALATPKRKAPGFALLGEPGEERDVVLELKTVADVALVGYPNAGKSSLIAAMSAAKPKIADYPFTTLAPNLGVVSAGESVFTVADVPGLIPGAAQGRGLGLEFLRHVERCRVLVHVLDCATLEPERDPLADYHVIEDELHEYDEFDDRPRIAVFNKVDVPDGRELARMTRALLEETGLRVFEVSAATTEGLRDLRFALAEIVDADRAARPAEEATRQVLRPRRLGEAGFSVKRVGEDAFEITGEKPERWVRQTDFGNDEAVGYLADRLARLGVEEEIRKAGGKRGSTVYVGDYVFDWEPDVPAEAERLGPRGTDPRLGGQG